MIIFLIIVLIIVVLLFMFEKDKINILKHLGITFVVTGSFMVVFGILFKIIIRSNIISIIFYVCGIISYVGYKLLKKV